MDCNDDAQHLNANNKGDLPDVWACGMTLNIKQKMLWSEVGGLGELSK